MSSELDATAANDALDVELWRLCIEAGPLCVIYINILCSTSLKSASTFVLTGESSVIGSYSTPKHGT